MHLNVDGQALAHEPFVPCHLAAPDFLQRISLREELSIWLSLSEPPPCANHISWNFAGTVTLMLMETCHDISQTTSWREVLDGIWSSLTDQTPCENRISSNCAGTMTHMLMKKGLDFSQTISLREELGGIWWSDGTPYENRISITCPGTETRMLMKTCSDLSRVMDQRPLDPRGIPKVEIVLLRTDTFHRYMPHTCSENPHCNTTHTFTHTLALGYRYKVQAPSPSPPVLVGKERATSKLQGCMSFYTSRIPS